MLGQMTGIQLSYVHTMRPEVSGCMTAQGMTTTLTKEICGKSPYLISTLLIGV